MESAVISFILAVTPEFRRQSVETFRRRFYRCVILEEYSIWSAFIADACALTMRVEWAPMILHNTREMVSAQRFIDLFYDPVYHLYFIYTEYPFKYGDTLFAASTYHIASVVFTYAVRYWAANHAERRDCNIGYARPHIVRNIFFILRNNTRVFTVLRNRNCWELIEYYATCVTFANEI